MQKTFSRATKLRAFLLTGAMVSVTALAFAHGDWASAVWAQTVPPLTPIVTATRTPHRPGVPAPSASPTDLTPLPSGVPATSEPTSAPALDLTPLPAVTEPPFTVALPAPVTGTAILDFGIGTVTARPDPGVADVTGATVAASDLAEPPAGWQLLTPGLRVGGLDDQSQPVLYFSRGFGVCLRLPAGAAAFRELRLGYYDTSPRLNRWVLLVTNVTADQACTALFRRAATFALFGR